jgi:hypothetical protein
LQKPRETTAGETIDLTKQLTSTAVSEKSSSEDDTDNIIPKNITGLQHAILKQAAYLMRYRTLFENPFPDSVMLSRWVVEVWEEAEKKLEVVRTQSKKARSLVSTL